MGSAVSHIGRNFVAPITRDKDGFNFWGIDKEGYNREGFDKIGYNREVRVINNNL